MRFLLSRHVRLCSLFPLAMDACYFLQIVFGGTIIAVLFLRCSRSLPELIGLYGDHVDRLASTNAYGVFLSPFQEERLFKYKIETG